MASPIAEDIFACLRFWSRLPVPAVGDANITRAIRMLPVAALVIALPAAVVLIIAHNVLSLPLPVCASLSIAALVATTGALHEDGLADTCDGLFGGATPARRLEIMRDSRIGAFGALALMLTIVVRIAALTALAGFSLALASAALLAGAALSRTVGLLPLSRLPAARTDGLGATAVRVDTDTLRTAGLLAALFLLMPLLAGASFPRVVISSVLALGAAYLLIPLARDKIGGQTGDIAGAAQQTAEVTFLAILSGAAST